MKYLILINEDKTIISAFPDLYLLSGEEGCSSSRVFEIAKKFSDGSSPSAQERQTGR
jgi:hypothetical protein